jgi:hypothetical protein
MTSNRVCEAAQITPFNEEEAPRWTLKKTDDDGFTRATYHPFIAFLLTCRSISLGSGDDERYWHLDNKGGKVLVFSLITEVSY